jgi:hypothetical protein
MGNAQFVIILQTCKLFFVASGGPYCCSEAFLPCVPGGTRKYWRFACDWTAHTSTSRLQREKGLGLFVNSRACWPRGWMKFNYIHDTTGKTHPWGMYDANAFKCSKTRILKSCILKWYSVIHSFCLRAKVYQRLWTIKEFFLAWTVERRWLRHDFYYCFYWMQPYLTHYIMLYKKENTFFL